MKKLLTLVLAAGMFTIYSCGSGSDSTAPAADSTAAPATETPAAEPAAAPAADTTMHTDTTAH